MADGSFKSIKDIKIGDFVCSFQNNKIVKKKVVNVFNNGKAFVVKYNDLICTDDHRVLECRLKNYLPIKKATHLVSSGELLFGKTQNIPLAKTLGLLLTDGYIKKNQTPKFTNVDMDLLDVFEKTVIKAFPDVQPKRYKKGNGFDITCATKKKTNFHPIRKYFKDSNTMPEIVWVFDKKSTLAFLSGVISGDGSFHYRKTKTPNGYLSLTGCFVLEAGVSKKLAEDYQKLFWKLGIRSKIKKDSRCNNYRVFVYSLRDMLKLGKINILSKHKQEKYNFLCKNLKLKKNINIHKIKTREDKGLANVWDIEVEDTHNYIANGYIVHNCGKDLCLWNYIIKRAFEETGLYYYLLPTYTQAKKIIWDGITNDGMRFLDYIPKEIIVRSNATELQVVIKNMEGKESIIQLIGTDKIDAIRGTNPKMVVFSEFAYHNPMAWEVIRPILTANHGVAIFNTTPNGKNFAHTIFKNLQNNPNAFTQVLNILDTGFIKPETIEDERRNGMSEEMIQQEFYCSFDIGAIGNYYVKQINEAQTQNRICAVPHDALLDVQVSLDLGRSDSTSLIFFQILGKEIRIIEAYEHNGEDVAFYVSLLKAKTYRYGTIFLPHDAFAKRMESKHSVAEQFEQAGFKVVMAPKASKQNGIQELKRIFANLWFDKDKTFTLRQALENYHKEYDYEKKIFKDEPFHDWSSHFADSARYMALSIPLITNNLKPKAKNITMRMNPIRLPSTRTYKT